MTGIITFRPSSIHPQTIFVSSPFEKGEKEAVSAFIVTFLAAHGDEWSSEFAWLDLSFWITSESAPVNEAYRVMSCFRGGQDIIHAIHMLIADGFIERRDDDTATYFRLAEKYVAFFHRYI